MGTKRFVPLLATALLLVVAAVADAGLIQPPELTSWKHSEARRNCDGGSCWFSSLRQKREDPPEPESEPTEEEPTEPGPTEPSPTEPGPTEPGPTKPSPTVDVKSTEKDPIGNSSENPLGGGASLPLAGEIPLPPVTQQMPNLPKNFPYPDVKVVQEPPVPTKPRKKPIMSVNPYPFPPIGPIDPEPPVGPIEPVDSPVEQELQPELVPEPVPVPVQVPEPVPADPIVPSIEPDEPSPSALPAKPVVPCKPSSTNGYGPPQDWRFPKARGHKKCPTGQTNAAMGHKGVEPPAVMGPDSEMGTDSVMGQDSVNFRTVARDEGGAAPPSPPGGGGSGAGAGAGSPAAAVNSSTPAVVCSMKTVLPAVVATILYTVL